MDDLNVAANVVSLIVLCYKYYYAILDKYIAVPSFNSIAVLNA
jgi:energy-converting hydrogenase Eha subunit E